MIRATLPWPPSALRPNAASPGNWRRKSTAAALYKSLCAIELRAQGIGRIDAERLHVTIRFCPPDRRRRDMDGMLSQIKHGLDAIAEAVRVDDYYFSLELHRGEPVKGGVVEVVLSEDAG